MLKFQVFENGSPAESFAIRNAYLIGSDHSAMRADITFQDGLIVCAKRELGSAALGLQRMVGECGELTVQTCQLPEREEPYLLSVELARHRLMMLYAKLEEWGMFDLGEDHGVSRRAEKARRLFIEALCLQNSEPSKADQYAQESLATAIDGSEELALAHAELLLGRRRAAGSLPRVPVGCGVALEQMHERVRSGLAAGFDFVNLPTPWRMLEPIEGGYQWTVLDNWMEWSARGRLPVMAGPVVCFEPTVLPDWAYIWEHDYEEIRDVVYEHVEQVVGRYRQAVWGWNVVSGLHVNSHLPLAFDQLLDLTRLSAMLVKKLAPQAKALVELKQPFGEYYGQNPRSIPPLMYADLLVQSAVAFDGFCVRLTMGQAVLGQYTRDLMQISHLLDQFATLGKPVYVIVGAPSDPVTDLMLASPDPGRPVDPVCGHWRRPWSQTVQSHWGEAVAQIALSKPFVEGVIWQDIVDHPGIELPLGGLINEDLQPKSAFRRLTNLRRTLQARPNPGSPTPGSPNPGSPPTGNPTLASTAPANTSVAGTAPGTAAALTHGLTTAEMDDAADRSRTGNQ